MKLYRCMDYKINMENGWPPRTHEMYLQEGNFNEAQNLVNCGVISPSSRYFDGYNPKYGSNTFNKCFYMTKYFYASLNDALCWAYMVEKDYPFAYKYKQKLESVILEIDIPDDLIKKFVGIGYYPEYPSYDSKVEFRIPYQILYDVLALEKKDSFYQTLDYYNSHISDEDLSSRDDYQKLMKNIRQEEKLPNIINYGVDDLFLHLCFKLKSNYKILFVEDTSIHKEEVKEIKKQRPNDYLKINEHSHLIKEDEKYIYEHTLPYLEEENLSLKKTLANKGIKFQSIN